METESSYFARVAIAIPGFLLAVTVPYMAGLRSGVGFQAVEMLGALTYPLAFQFVLFGLYLRVRGVDARSVSIEGPTGALSTPLGRLALCLWVSAVVVVSMVGLGGPFDGSQWLPVVLVAVTTAITVLYFADCFRKGSR